MEKSLENSANQIQLHTKQTTNHDQVGFIPITQGWFKIQKLINIIYHLNRMKKKDTWSTQLMQKKYFTKFKTISK